MIIADYIVVIIKILILLHNIKGVLGHKNFEILFSALLNEFHRIKMVKCFGGEKNHAWWKTFISE